MTGLRIVPYVLSKYLVLGILCIIQSALLTGLFTVLVGKPDSGVIFDPVLEILITVFMTAMASVSMGLFVSCFFKNPDQAMTVAPLLLIPQILFSGLLFKLEGIKQTFSNIVVCRWSMEGLGTTADLNSLFDHIEINGQVTEITKEAEDFFLHTKDHLLHAWIILLLFVIVLAVFDCIVLQGIRREQ